MLTRIHSIEGKETFDKNLGLFGKLDAESAMKLAMVAGDITLVLDEDGTIVDTAFDPQRFSDFEGWTGRNWIDTVTDESRVKVMEMLAAARRGEVQHWRQVNHTVNQGDLAVRYVVITVNGGKHRIAIGRDLREASRMQQRFLQVQQSLERDYMRMRQLEARYRTLFAMTNEAIMIVEASTLRVREANPAAHTALGVREGSLAGKKLPALLARDSRDAFQAFSGAAISSNTIAPIEVGLARSRDRARVSASGFTQDRGRFLLLRIARIDDDHGSSDVGYSPVLDLVETMPDAFVVSDHEMNIVSANAAFVELSEAASADQLRGQSLAQWIGRPGIDLELIEGQIEQHGSARNVTTVLRNRDTGDDEPVELSAVRSVGSEALYAFIIRPIGRRLRDLASASQDLPRSVEQLTDLVGRMPLKEIVRESTDLIERLCIEAALSYTSDNRASAAEILGLSRQSLYSKLHRHGLGNLPSDPD